jgi:mannose-6-phosphate isomerase-like protein (cupin superfamily)
LTANITQKPWGHEELVEHNGRYCIKHLVIRPGGMLSKQYHRVKQESLCLIEGEAEIELDGVFLAMESGRWYPITPGLVHRMRCSAGPGAKILEVSTPELDDVVRLEDQYGRADASSAVTT